MLLQASFPDRNLCDSFHFESIEVNIEGIWAASSALCVFAYVRLALQAIALLVFALTSPINSSNLCAIRPPKIRQQLIANWLSWVLGVWNIVIRLMQIISFSW